MTTNPGANAFISFAEANTAFGQAIEIKEGDVRF